MRAQGLVSLFWYMKGGSSTCYIMCTIIDTLAGRPANTKWHPSFHSPFRGKALYPHACQSLLLCYSRSGTQLSLIIFLDSGSWNPNLLLHVNSCKLALLAIASCNQTVIMPARWQKEAFHPGQSITRLPWWPKDEERRNWSATAAFLQL